jgi:hypothetical protein
MKFFKGISPLSVMAGCFDGCEIAQTSAVLLAFNA